MVGRMPNVKWLEGSFVESIKGWQSGWFYITEPRDANWVAALKFRSGISTWLVSWTNKGPDWGSTDEVMMLQKRIKCMINKHTSITDVIQVMLFRRILPCQERAFNLWEFDPAPHQTLRELFDTTHKGIWKVLFKGAEVLPSLTEDHGLSAKRPANPVSSVHWVGYLFPIA